MLFKLPTLTILCIFLLFTGSALAAKGIGIDVGTNVSRNDNSPIDYYRLHYKWDWRQTWFESGNWYLKAHNEVSYIRLLSNVEVRRRHAPSTLTAVSLIPVFRYQRYQYANGLAPFVEIGIGVTYFSDSQIQSQPYWFRDFGGRFQFEDRLAMGMVYKDKYKFSVNFTHYSNANISPPNEGIDLVSTSFSYNF